MIRSTEKVIGDHRLRRKLVHQMVVNEEDIDDTTMTISEREDAMRAAQLLLVAPSHQHSLVQRSQPPEKGRDQYHHLMIIIGEL